MSVVNRISSLLLLSVLAAAGFPPSASGVALVSNDLELFLPWVQFQGQTYAAELSPAGGEGLAFALDKISPRQAPSIPAQAAAVDVNADLDVDIPLVSFLGELYSAQLTHDGGVEFSLAGAAPFVPPQGRGAVLSAEFMESKTVEQIAADLDLPELFAAALHYDVALFRVGYQTLDAFGNLTPASGVIGVPLGVQDGAPIFSFQHGTIASRADAPSANPAPTQSDIALYLMAAGGYVAMAPDYLGFGDSSGLHPYVHAKTLAWAVIDLIRATRTLAANVDYPLNGQLFLAGYSEGGFATMAAQREIETHHAGEMTITASAPMAGPYDLSGTMLDLAVDPGAVPSPLYFPYVILAYNEIYGFEDDVRTLLAADQADTIVALFDGHHDSDEINAALPSSPVELYAPYLLDVWETGAYHPMRSALENNDVYRWKPVSPTRLYHCLDDDEVPYANSVVAQEYFANQGADVDLVTLYFGGHVACSVPAMLAGKAWFDSLADLP